MLFNDAKVALAMKWMSSSIHLLGMIFIICINILECEANN